MASGTANRTALLLFCLGDVFTVKSMVHAREWEQAGNQLPWITERKDLRYLLSVVKRIVVASGLRTELSLTSFRQGGLTEGADSGLTDAELRAAARHRSTRQLPTYAKRTRKQLISIPRNAVRSEQRQPQSLLGTTPNEHRNR